MRKIPTLFRRDPDDRKHVLPEVTPGCEWVLAGEGVATRKWDGTCVMFDGEGWWGRREVKPGKTPPPGWVEVDVDETTGKRMGWEPAEQSSFAKFLVEAVGDEAWSQGTYELIGPKINGNPEGVERHTLVRHGDVRVFPPGRSFDWVRAFFVEAEGREVEGIVFHHDDGRMAKIKRRDFS